MEDKVIYTIGHSTHSLEDFIAMLHSFEIQNLADIRSLPGSRKFPWFDKENLEAKLPEAGISYTLIADLGGRRRVKKDSKNTRWRNASFRGYADYMETEGFEKGIKELLQIAKTGKTVYMCAEAVWWRCHRSMVSDYLTAKGWTVMHIMGIGKANPHRYTAPAIIHGDCVSYSDEDSDVS